VPVTLAERCFLIFAMLVGASLYAYVVGSVCGIVSAMDVKQSEFYSTVGTDRPPPPPHCHSRCAPFVARRRVA